MNRNQTQKNHYNTLIEFSLHGFNKHLPWFRCGGKGEHLNLASRQNPAVNPLTANVLQEFLRLRPRFRSQPGLEHRRTQMYPGALLAGVSTKHAAEQPNLNRSKTRKIRCNTLRYFPLQGFNKHLPWFRCGGKGEHLNLASRQNPADNPLTTNVLQDFQQLHPRFRSQPGLECRGMQMYPGGTSGRGIHQTRSRTAHASEPELNPRNSPQLIEKLSIARFQQASPLVQMRR